MASPAAVLSILVEANTSAANANLAKTNAELDATKASAVGATGATSKTSGALKKLGTAAKWGGAALAVGFVVEAKKAVTSTQDLTKTTLTLHKNLGLTVKQSSEWGAALKARGADSQKAGMAFKTFATQLSAAGHGSATSIAMFKELGFSQQDIQKSMTNTQFALGKVSDGLNHLPAGADKATFAGKLFGRGWQTVAPILRDGSASMQQVLDTQEKYGAFLEGKGFAQQKTLLQNIKDNKSAWLGLQVQLANFVTPALNKASDQFQHLAKVMADPKLTDDQKFKKVSRIIRDDLGKITDFLTTKVLPQVISSAADAAPKVAGALVKGFIDAPVLGKLLLSVWLIKKLGGWGLINAIGSRFGTRLGTSMSTSTVEQGGWRSAGTKIGGMLGPAVAAAAVPILMIAYRKQITDWFHSHDFTLPTETVPGKSNINPDTSASGLLKGFTGALGGLGGPGITNANKALKDLTKSGIKDFGSLTEAAKHWSKDTKDSFEAAAMASKLPDHAVETLRKIIEGSTNVSGKDIKNLAQVTGLSAKQIQGSSKDTAQRWSKDQKSVQKDSQDTNKKVSDAAGKMAKNVSGSYGNMVAAAGDGMNRLKDNTNNALKGLGMTKKQVSFAINTAHLQGTPGAHQKGGLAGIVPGHSTGDNHTLSMNGMPIAKVESGEGIYVGNRTLMAQKAQENAQVPRRAKGGYVYPFDKGMPLGRTDMGVDANTPGAPIGAIGDASVTSQTNAFTGYGSPNQGMVYRLDNPPKGYSPSSPYVYIYEGLDKVGGASGHLNAGQLLGHIHASYPGIEMGWAAGPSGGALAASHYSEGDVTAEGSSFRRFLMDLASGKAVSGAVAQRIARVLLKGPKGPLLDMGQAALDKTWHAANAFLGKQAPKASALGSGLGSLGKLGHSVRGKVSWFTGGSTAGGYNASTDAGIALNLNPGTDSGWNNPTTQGWMQMARAGHPQVAKVGIAGHTAALPIIDLGPAGFTGRAIDVTGPGVRKLGLSTASFPTDSIGTAKYQRGGMVMPPYGGSFGQGGVVPGPLGSPRTIVAHGGETVERKPTRYAITITNWQEGRGYMEEVADGVSLGNRRLVNQKRRMRR